jgi:hypothetical protein
MAPQPGSIATTPTTAAATVFVEFYILDQNDNKHTGSLSFSDTASGATYRDAVNNLRKLISSKIDKIENSIPPNISDFFKNIDIQYVQGFGIEITFQLNDLYIPSPIFIPIHVSNVSIKWN